MKLTKRKDTKKTTEEKIEERREEVLATGRKFKYPLQWSRHRIVVNTILIATVVLAIVIAGVWFALYRLNMTDEMLYRITKIVPVPVAKVDDENVLFSDYLMLYRSSITSIERQSGNQFNEETMDQLRTEYKESALLESEKYTYALKLAKDKGIEVSHDEIDKEFNRHMGVGGSQRSEESFLKIIGDNFGLSKSEYERMLYLSLTKAKVEEAIDTKANEIASKVESSLAGNGGDYKAVAETMGDSIVYQETGGLVDNRNIDGGRASEAAKLEPGQSSGKFVSMNGDGYYFVKLVSKTDAEVNFVSIKVPFTEFDSLFAGLEQDGKIAEYITLTIPNGETAEPGN